MGTDITYNGSLIRTIEGGETATFSCEGTKAKSNVSIVFGSKGSITYKGKTTEIEKGKTANLLCIGKKFGSDVVVAVEKAQSNQIIVGVTGLNNVDGTLTLTDDASGLGGYTQTVNGDYVNVTSPLSDYFPFNKIEEFTDDSGNVFVKFPQLWMKWETDNANKITGYKFANYQADDGYFIPDAFLDPTNTTQDTYLPYFALGKYEMSGSASKGYSKSGAACLKRVTRGDARGAARAYGDANNLYNGYQQLDFAQYVLYNLLCMMFYQHSNIQKVYGGRTGLGTVTTWTSASVTGTCDGLSGMNGWNTSTDCVKMLGVENPYGNIGKWVDGIYFVGSTSGSTIYVHRYPQQFADSTSNGITLGFSCPVKTSYIVSFKKGTTVKNQSYMFCYAVEGEENKYCGDRSSVGSSATVLHVGGYWDRQFESGLWNFSGISSSAFYGDFIGARLAFRPVNG